MAADRHHHQSELETRIVRAEVAAVRDPQGDDLGVVRWEPSEERIQRLEPGRIGEELVDDLRDMGSRLSHPGRLEKLLRHVRGPVREGV